VYRLVVPGTIPKQSYGADEGYQMQIRSHPNPRLHIFVIQLAMVVADSFTL